MYKRYRNLAKPLIVDVNSYYPGVKIVVITDDPDDFSEYANVIAIKHKQQSMLIPLNDKRRVIEEGLKRFPTVICVDSDCRLTNNVASKIEWPPGIVSNYDTERSMWQNIEKFCPQDVDVYRKLLTKIPLVRDLRESKFAIPNFFIISRDNGKEKDFLEYWRKIILYTELHRCKNVFDAYPLGVSLACVGWSPKLFKDVHPELGSLINHIGQYSSGRREKETFISRKKKQFLFRYRWVKILGTCLSDDFNFYFK